MTSSDLPPGAPVDSGDVGTRSRWPSQGQALSMIGAFLVGACICGGAGVVIGALAGKHAPGQGGRGAQHRVNGGHARTLGRGAAGCQGREGGRAYQSSF